MPTNNAVALFDAIEYLIENPDEWKKMGAADWTLAEKEFSIEKIVAEHMKVYWKLLDKVEVRWRFL